MKSFLLGFWNGFWIVLPPGMTFLCLIFSIFADTPEMSTSWTVRATFWCVLLVLHELKRGR